MFQSRESNLQSPLHAVLVDVFTVQRPVTLQAVAEPARKIVDLARLNRVLDAVGWAKTKSTSHGTDELGLFRAR